MDSKEKLWLEKAENQILQSDSGDFPELLQRIPGPPTLLYMIGSADALHLPALSIVGSRNPTRGGRENAYEFAKHLGQAGFCIVSGCPRSTKPEKGPVLFRGAGPFLLEPSPK